MGRWLARYWQTALVGVLFAASVGALAAAGAGVILLPRRELEARDELLAAAADLARAGTAAAADLPPEAGCDRPLPDAFDRRLAAVAARVLAAYPGAEGGFYVGGDVDQFGGYAKPPAPEPAGVVDPKGKDGKGKKGKSGKVDLEKARPGGGRREPPPLETPSIRQQAREALRAPADDPPLVEIRDVGPSRVAVATAAVGDERPARLAAWVMVRLSDPARQKAQLDGYLVSAALALGGILLALGLTARLARSLAHERAQRERLAGELRKAEHLAGLGRLLAGMAHEVRNPLAAISSTVQLWERLPAEARTPESLAAVAAAVRRLSELVGRLLYFARSGHEPSRPVDLTAVVAETLALTRAQAAAQGVAVTADLAPDLPSVRGAADPLRQVVANLIANALQAMPSGGRLACRTRTAPGGWVELTVADTGPGVPPAARDRIFEPFFTTRPDGTGLGLALCREIVSQHGGLIEMVPGVAPDAPGATFRVLLPAGHGGAPGGEP